MYNRLEVSYPIGFNEFKCIGGRCEDTCCKGWDIEVDRDTFQEYCALENNDMKLVIQNNIHINEECTSDDLDYGVIKLNDQKRCPFLDKCDYCSIYTNIGEEYLSNICTQFPRILNKIDNKYEISLDVACPEAAKLILTNKDSITFQCSEEKFTKYIINDEYNTNSKKYKNSPIKYLKEIRYFAINIIQNRNYDLDCRLYVLGDFLKQLEERVNEKSGKVIEFINKYEINSIAQNYRRDEKNYLFQSVFFKKMINDLSICKEAISTAFRNITEEVLSYLDFKGSFNNEEDYIHAYENYDKEIISKYSYVFENYLVNYMYNNLFPFSESDDMFEGYIMLVVRYSFIRFYLVENYINNKNVSEEEVVKFIALFARNVEHDKSYMSEILNYIEENKDDNLDFIEKLL